MKLKMCGFAYDIDLNLLIFHLVYFLLLFWVYSHYVVVIYAHAGFADTLNINKAIISCSVIAVSFLILHNNGMPSFFFLNIIIALIITPSFVITSGSDLPFSFLLVTWAAYIIIVLVVRFVRIPRIKIKQIQDVVLLRAFALLGVLFIANIFALGGGQYFNINFARVYDFREVAAKNVPDIFAYLSNNFSQAIIPLCLVLAVIKRRWSLMLVFMFSGFMLFGLFSHKSALLLPLMTLFFYWIAKHKNALKLALLSFILIVVIGGMDWHIKQSGVEGISGWFGFLFVERAIITPSWLNWGYYDFFTVNPHHYWAHSKISLGLVESNYDIRIDHLIGREFLGDEAIGANTGWIGSGMGQAGYFGVALYSVLFGLLLSLVDAYAKKLGRSLVLAIFFIPVVVIATSVDLTTVLLTNGLLLTLLIVVLLKKPLVPNSFQHYKEKVNWEYK